MTKINLVDVLPHLKLIARFNRLDLFKARDYKKAKHLLQYSLN